LQHLIVEGLVNCGSAEAKEFAEDIATRWIRTNYAAYKASGVMYEKYDVEFCGRSGGSSEYKHQVWTFFFHFILNQGLKHPLPFYSQLL
jgi:alpha,alpha-trehalase